MSKSMEKHHDSFSQGRRNFGKISLASIIGSRMIFSIPGSLSAEQKSEPQKDTLSMAIDWHVLSDISDQDLLFYKQIGLNHVTLLLRGDEEEKLENILTITKRIKGVGFDIVVMGNYKYLISNVLDTITLGLPGRDKKIDELALFLNAMSIADIHVYDMGVWLPSKLLQYYSEPIVMSNRGYSPAATVYYDYLNNHPPLFDRIYTQEEMWDNFMYFMERVLPIAEENNVKISLHPWFPVPSIAGVGNIFSSFENCKRAIESVASKNFGYSFCVGTWAMDYNGMLGDVYKALRYFGERNRLFWVHVRNVTSSLNNSPSLEVLPDDGYIDMYRVVKILKEVKYRGSIYPDHLPQFINSSAGKGAELAFAVGYIRALVEAVDKESYQG
jgi:mannonate dehydratase